MELDVRAREARAPGTSPVEVAERKGLGHPDSMCDGIAEHVSVRLCHAYLERFGVILHHNVDKVLLCAGAARPAFGGGDVIEPMEIVLAGRATADHGGAKIPVHDIAVDACKEWLRATLPHVDVDRHVRVVSRIRPGSADLRRLFARDGAAPLANDTSMGTGFAPFTDLERTVLAVERTLNAASTKTAHPAIGEDIKVMGVRRDGRIRLTISCAFVDRFVAGVADYVDNRDAARELVVAAAREVTALPVEASLNAGDDIASGDVFLTVTGTSAEAGDDGEVGRGNRVCGLITPYRPMSLEAAAGKNPVTHVGKLYNLVATRLASSLVASFSSVEDAACVLVSEIGRAVDDPALVDVELGPAGAHARLEAPVRDLVRAELARIPDVRAALLAETLPVW